MLMNDSKISFLLPNRLTSKSTSQCRFCLKERPIDTSTIVVKVDRSNNQGKYQFETIICKDCMQACFYCKADLMLFRSECRYNIHDSFTFESMLKLASERFNRFNDNQWRSVTSDTMGTLHEMITEVAKECYFRNDCMFVFPICNSCKFDYSFSAYLPSEDRIKEKLIKEYKEEVSQEVKPYLNKNVTTIVMGYL
jgi:hypothetical protein